MTSNQRPSGGTWRRGPIAAAAGFCLMVAGCGTTPVAPLGSLSPLGLVPSGFDHGAGKEIPREEVEADPFPRGPGTSEP